MPVTDTLFLYSSRIPARNVTISDLVLSSCPSSIWPPLSIVTSFAPGILSAMDRAFT
jgi:hypothetical protein